MNLKKMYVLYCVLVVIVVAANACRKHSGGDERNGVPPYEATETREVAVLKETSEVLEEVYKDSRALAEVNAAIRCGFYEDERVLLKDLLFPASSKLYENPVFRKSKIDTGVFRKRFCEIIILGNYPVLTGEIMPALISKPGAKYSVASSSKLPQVIGVMSASDPIAIYFPYSENFPAFDADSLPADNKIAILLRPTIVYSNGESDVAKGRDPYYCPGNPGNICYRDVTVDDNYAYARATHILTTGAVKKETIVPVVPKTDLVHRVYHGTSRLTRQMDRLISLTGNGGGSEVKVCRINGYLRRSDEQIDDFAGDVVTLYYTRGEIRNKQWKRVFSIWDPNWNYQDVEQIYAVYEEDTRGTRTIDGSLTTTLNIPGKLGKAEGEIGFKIQTNTQDEILSQRKLDRKSYFKDGLNNQGWGFVPDPADFLPLRTDWPIYDGGSIWQYTLPYRIH